MRRQLSPTGRGVFAKRTRYTLTASQLGLAAANGAGRRCERRLTATSPEPGRRETVAMAGAVELSSEAFGDDRRKHLEFIQNVIARMSSASSVAKGWCLTVATGALGFAVTQQSRSVALLGLLSVVLFGLLDTRYLREERKFRCLYEDARFGRVAVYEMRAHDYTVKSAPHYNDRCAWRHVVTSWSLWAFYGPLIAVAVAVFVRACLSR